LVSATEGLSVAILEAMAAGLPVVATDVGGNRELVRQGLNGYVTPVDEPEAMMTSLRHLVGDKALRLRMGEAGRRIVRDEYAMDAMVAQYNTVYEQVTGGVIRG
jgi:glycosyltransferase involved in cell wall biosynthesis